MGRSLLRAYQGPNRNDTDAEDKPRESEKTKP